MADVIAAWSAAPATDGSSASATSPAEPAELPLADATLLLAVAEDVLDEGEAAWVHHRLTAAVADALPVVATLQTPAVEPVVDWLQRRYDQAGTLAQLLVDVRGLQIAGLWCGLHVQVDPIALMGTAAACPPAATRSTELWRRMRAYRMPHRGAVCALAAARLTTTELREIRMGQARDDGTTVTVAGRDIAVEPAAAEYVATQRLLRTASGAKESDPLLTDGDGKPISDKEIARILSLARIELGVVVTSRLVVRTPPSTASALARCGVTVTRIGEPAPAEPQLGPPAAADDGDTTTGVNKPLLLDVELVRRRRTELNLTRRALARHLGDVSPAVVGRLENGGNHEELPLGLLARLAATLGVDLPTLLGGRSAGRDTTASASDQHEDARAVGAALHTLGVLVPTSDLARTLGWPAARLRGALDQLTVDARAVGLRVHRLYDRVSLVRDVDALPLEGLAAVARYSAARSGLTTTQARLVHAALVRAARPPERRGGGALLATGNADRVAAGTLINAGILAINSNGDLMLSPDTARSLLVAC